MELGGSGMVYSHGLTVWPHAMIARACEASS
jgi:hypothetical protein